MTEYIVNAEEERLFYGDKYEELVRCKDCHHYNKGENERESWEECNRTMKSTSADDFCSWAKMKGGSDD